MVEPDSVREFPVSWAELHRDGRALAWQLRGRKEFRGLVSVTRGGLVPSAIVARELGLRVIDSISVASYDVRSQGEVQILKGLSEDFLRDRGKDLVVVDDLTDTGATFMAIKEFLPEACYATIYAKPAGKSAVDVYITEVSQDTWILFPWDGAWGYTKPLVGQ